MTKKKNGRLRTIIIILLIISILFIAVYSITYMRTQAGYFDNTFWISVDRMFFPILIGIASIFATMFSDKIKKIIGIK